MSIYLFQALLTIYLFLAPTVGFGVASNWHDEQRLGQLGLFLVLFFLFFFRTARVQFLAIAGLFDPAAVRGIGLVVFLGALSAASAPSSRWAFLEWATFGMLSLLGFLLAGMRYAQGRRFDRWGLGICVASAAAYLAGVAVAYLAVFLEGLPLLVWELFHGFSNIRFFGHFQSMTLPLLVVPAVIWTIKPYQRAALAILCCGWWMLAIASGTRGTWLGMLVVFFLAVFCHQVGRRWLRTQIVFLLCGILGYLLFFEVLPAIVGLERVTITSARFANITGLSGREVLWWQALDMILAHPFLGIGPMHLAYYPTGIAAHPHNSILQWAAEWGLPSAALLVFGGGLGLRRLFRRLPDEATDDNEAVLRVALLFSLVAALTQSLVDGVIVMPYSQIWLALIFGWAIGLHFDDRLVKPTIWNGSVAGWAPLLAAAFLGGLIALGVEQDVGHLKEREVAFVQKHPGALFPRYWEQGVIFE